MSELAKLQTDLKLLIKFKIGYKKELLQYLSEGYSIAKENLFVIVLQKGKLVPVNKRKFHIDLDGFIEGDNAQYKLEKLLNSLWNACKWFEDDGIEVEKMSSTFGDEQDESN